MARVRVKDTQADTSHRHRQSGRGEARGWGSAGGSEDATQGSVGVKGMIM